MGRVRRVYPSCTRGTSCDGFDNRVQDWRSPGAKKCRTPVVDFPHVVATGVRSVHGWVSLNCGNFSAPASEVWQCCIHLCLGEIAGWSQVKQLSWTLWVCWVQRMDCRIEEPNPGKRKLFPVHCRHKKEKNSGWGMDNEQIYASARREILLMRWVKEINFEGPECASVSWGAKS